jgi:hypothetical protein
MPELGDGGIACYAQNASWAKLQVARTSLLLGAPLDEALVPLDEGIRRDPYGLLLRFWKTRWLAEAGRAEDAARAVENMRTPAGECTSPGAALWVALAEAELALGGGDVAGAQERLATVDAGPRGAVALVVVEWVRARVARAAGDAPGEVAAWRAALQASRSRSIWEADLAFHALYRLADAEDRAGEHDAARDHGRELLSAWSECRDEVALLADARRRWGD